MQVIPEAWISCISCCKCSPPFLIPSNKQCNTLQSEDSTERVSDADWFIGLSDHVPSSCFVFFSPALSLGGSWWCLVALLWLWLGVPGALASWHWWPSGPTGLGSGSLCGIAIAEPQGSAAVAGLLSENLHWKSHLPTTTSASGPFHLCFAQSVPYVQRGDTEKIGKRCFSSKLVKTGDCNSLCLELFNKM